MVVRLLTHSFFGVPLKVAAVSDLEYTSSQFKSRQ